MIDIHSHFLPHIDDGAKDVDEAITLLEHAKAGGTDVIVATPHCRAYDNSEIHEAVKTRDEALDLVNEAAIKRGSAIPEIHKGFEVYLDADITQSSDYKMLCIDDTCYMLVEMPFKRWSKLNIMLLENLRDCGVKPILAHLERYAGFPGNIKAALSVKDIIYQVNADSFLSFPQFLQVSRIVRHSNICVAGSDMHNLKRRISHMAEAQSKVSGNPAFDGLFSENARMILQEK